MKTVWHLLALVFLPLSAVQAQNSGPDLTYADSLAGAAIELEGNYEYAQAIPLFKEALAVFSRNTIPDTSRYSTIIISYGYALSRLGREQEAISQMDRLRPLVREHRDTTAMIKVENYSGLYHRRQSRYPQAIERFRLGLELAVATDDSLWQAILFDNMGGAYSLLGEFTKTIDYRRKALKLFEKVGTTKNVAVTLNNLGLVYVRLSMYDKAYEYLSQSLNLAEEMGLEEASWGSGVLTNLGLVYENIGQYDRAMGSYKKALELARKDNEIIKQKHNLQNLGVLYSNLGDEERALAYYLQSLDLMNRYNISSPDELSTIYSNIAVRQMDMGRAEEAGRNFYKALELRKQAGNRGKIAISYLDIASVERRKGNFEQALEYAVMGKELADELGLSREQMNAYLRVGEIYRTMGEYDMAIRNFRSSYRIARSTSWSNSLRPLWNLAYAFDEVGSDSAVYYGRELVELVEENRNRVGELSSLKTSFFNRYSRIYVDLASWVLRYEDDAEEAFRLVEASKARTLLEELVHASQDLDEQLPLETRLKKQRLRMSVENLKGRLDTVMAEQRQKELNRKLREAELEYATYVNEVRADNPVYKKLQYPSPVTADQARLLLDEDTAALQYAFSHEDLLVFFITHSEIRVKQIDIAPGNSDDEEMGRLVQTFRERILDLAPQEEIEQLSAELNRFLIDPYRRELDGYENIIIIPDESLAYLPFESLRFRNRYLIERFGMKYIPSFTAYGLLNQEDSSPSFRHEMLAIAGSGFTGAGGSMQAARSSYPPLPATLAEVNSIGKKFRDATILKRGEFSEPFIKEVLTNNYRFIHLATHGIINEKDPSMSGLALSSSPDHLTADQDGMLRSSEIYQLDINSELVVLSACNSGLGKVVHGEGMLGLQRSFFYAGVPTVSVSLWNIYDRSTAYFMDHFYAGLLEAEQASDSGWGWDSLMRWLSGTPVNRFGSAAEAMRRAKLKMLEHPTYRHPVYWAPFIVVGK